MQWMRYVWNQNLAGHMTVTVLWLSSCRLPNHSEFSAMINTHEDESGEASGKRAKVWYCPYKFQAYGEEEIKAVEECLRDGWLAPGPRTAQFESLVASFCGKKYGVMVNSGSAGNTLALLIAGVKEGDEVITPACTFSTVLAPLVQMRAVPVFCDVQLDTFVPTVEQVMACITPKTKCIYLPDLAGIVYYVATYA